ncbi:T9SS type A sorting domain-containing protein [Balneolales bacterium ANBcel1]|nr:T9SS type A sorting domain-containing protein [Balneolales bacterium ANBcel1]
MNEVHRAVTTYGGILTAVLLGALCLAAGDAYGQHSGTRSAVTGSVSNVGGQGVAGAGVHLVDQVLNDTLATAQSGPDGMFVLEYDSDVGLARPYPNPTLDVAHIVVTSGGGNKRVGVYDVLGREVFGGDVEFGEGNNRVTVGPFPGSGVYLVNVRGEGINETVKLTSLSAASGFAITVASQGGSGGPSSLSLVVDESENYKGVIKPVRFGRNVNESITLKDQLFEATTRGRLLDAAGADVQGRVVTSYAEAGYDRQVQGSFEFSRDVAMRLKGDPVTYAFSADGFTDALERRRLKDVVDLGDVALGDEYFEMVSKGHLVDVDGGDIHGRVVISYADVAFDKPVQGSFEFSRDVAMRLKGEPVVYAFSADGFEPAATEHVLKERLELGDIVLVRTAPRVSVSAPAVVDWFSGDFNISASSPNELDSLALEVDGSVYGWDVSGNDVSKDVSHVFEGTGSLPYTVKVFDAHGTKKVLEDFVNVRDRHDFRVQARGFFGKEPNPYASIEARHLESGKDTLLVADEGGVIRASIPRGNYVFMLGGGEEASKDGDGIPGMSEVNRLLVEYDNHPAPAMYWHGAERNGTPITYLVSGYGPGELVHERVNSSNVPVLFRHVGDFNSHLETVENVFDVDTHGYFIDEWSRISRPILADPRELGSVRYSAVVLPDASVEQVVVFNLGNSAYGRGWSVAGAAGNDVPREDHPDGGLYLPGSVWSEEELANWEIFKEDIGGVLEDSLDINPYSIKFVEDYAENLTDLGYVNDFGGFGAYMTIADNVMYVGRTRGGGIENSRSRSVIKDGYASAHRVMEASYFFVSGSLPSWYTNELRHFFSTTHEPNPGICSVKDHLIHPAFNNPSPPDYCAERMVSKEDEDGVARSGNPKDFMVWMASAGYASFIQQQVNGQFARPVWEGDAEKINYLIENDEWDMGRSGSAYPGVHYSGANLMLNKEE